MSKYTDAYRREQAALKSKAQKAGYQQFKNASYQRGANARAHDKKYSGQTIDRINAIRKADEKLDKWLDQQERNKKSALQEEARKATESPTKYFTAADYYEKAYNLHHGTNNCPIDKPQAAQTYWKALICGDGRAAFDLFVMLYNGDGIAQNHELSLIMCAFAFRSQETRVQQCRGKIEIADIQNKLANKIFREFPFYKYAFPNGINQQITPKLFNMLKHNVDKATNEFNPKYWDSKAGKSILGIFTNLSNHTIDEYLVTPDQLPHDNINETTPLIGNSDSDYLCEGCVIF